MSGARTELTLGPILFNWAPETWRDFYFRIADEAPVSVVYLGETICSKRAPLFRDHYEAVAERLRAAGKTVVHSTLGETASRLDRRLVSDVCERTSDLVEANDASAAFHLRGRPHCIGPLMNVYNEETLRFLAAKGAQNICLPIELPSSAIGVLCAAARTGERDDRGSGVRPPVAGAFGAVLSRPRARPHQGHLPVRLRERSRRPGAVDARAEAVSRRQRRADPVLRIPEPGRRKSRL